MNLLFVVAKGWRVTVVYLPVPIVRHSHELILCFPNNVTITDGTVFRGQGRESLIVFYSLITYFV